MTAAVGLFVVAAMLAGPGGRALSRARWPSGAPALALVLWHSLSAGILVSAVLGTAVLAMPAASGAVADVAWWLGACLGLLEEHYATPLGTGGAMVSIILASCVLGRAAACLAVEEWNARKARATLRTELTRGTGGTAPECPIVLDDPRLGAFCIPGRKPVIVVTAGALAALTVDERHAVLAHERAHLRSRHHWAVTSALSLYRAFPFIPAFRHAARQVPLLVEMHADDAASRESGRWVLARALVQMASGGGPVAALSISGSDALTRVQRLASDPRRIGRTARMALATGAGVLLLAPVLIMLAPAVEAMRDHCVPYQHACDTPGRTTHRLG